jgi:hypothetical protein
VAGEVAKQNDFIAHLRADPRGAHGIWQMIVDQTAIKSRAKFRAYQTTQQTNLTALSWTKVTLDAESYDIGGYFNTTDSKFVAPVDGFYLFTAQVTLASGTFSALKKFGIALYKASAAIATAYFSSNNDGDDIVLQINDIVRLDANDEITVYVVSGNDNNNTDLTAGEAVTYFSGHILSTDN